jgi:hypothetical protein
MGYVVLNDTFPTDFGKASGRCDITSTARFLIWIFFLFGSSSPAALDLTFLEETPLHRDELELG